MGFEPDAFWRQTPRRIEIVFEGRLRRARLDHDQRMHLAWHIAALAMAGIGGKLPALEDLQARDEPPPPKSAEDLRALLIAALGPPPEPPTEGD